MLKKFVNYIAGETELNSDMARSALGIVLNAADRQGSQFATLVFENIPGARTLSATSGVDVGAATGIIARLIEQTPGGRSAVAFQMVRDLQNVGLGNEQISKLMPTIADFARAELGYEGVGHIGDFLGAGEAVEKVKVA